MLGLDLALRAAALALQAVPPPPCPAGCGDPLSCLVLLGLRIVAGLLGGC